MNVVIKGAILVNGDASAPSPPTNIIIQDGTIRQIGTEFPADATVVEAENLHVCPGFVDVFSHFCDPGFEFRETLESGTASAAAGGYTDVLLLPNTSPVNHNKAGTEYLVQRTKSFPVTVHPIGAVTKDAAGKELAEMYDMHLSGALAFSDGLCPLQSSGLALKALQYVKAIDKPIIQLPNDVALSAHGLMNEGVVSTRLGLAGSPALAEELMIARDIELVKYTDARLHITGVSTAKGLQLIREAKMSDIPLSCSVTPHHLTFTDEDLADYDTNLKLLPPLRTAADREAVRDAVLDGTVDCIASHHLPQHTDQKVVEFEYAKPGMISLETAFAAVRTAVPQLSVQRLVALFAIQPRKLFGLPVPVIKVGQPACLTLFSPTTEWTPTGFRSRSRNSAFVGRRLTGRPLGIIHKDRLFLAP